MDDIHIPGETRLREVLIFEYAVAYNHVTRLPGSSMSTRRPHHLVPSRPTLPSGACSVFI